MAYYPTEVPFHHRSAWLGGRDVFGELVDGCRKMGMTVIARTDPHATYDDVKEAHPDWIAVGADGKPRRHWASPELWLTCALGPYNFEFMTSVKREIMTRYRVDGIFINRWDGVPTCYCAHCQANFRQATGRDLPRTDNPRDPAHRAYLVWRQDRLFQLWRLWVNVDGAEPRRIDDEAQARFRANDGTQARPHVQDVAPFLEVIVNGDARKPHGAPSRVGSLQHHFKI